MHLRALQHSASGAAYRARLLELRTTELATLNLLVITIVIPVPTGFLNENISELDFFFFFSAL